MASFPKNGLQNQERDSAGEIQKSKNRFCLKNCQSDSEIWLLQVAVLLLMNFLIFLLFL